MTPRTGDVALVNYTTLQSWVPRFGDFVVWAGWLNTWYGVVASWDSADSITVIFESGAPFLLFTMPEAHHPRNTKALSLSRIKNSRRGEFAVSQHERESNLIVWYV